MKTARRGSGDPPAQPKTGGNQPRIELACPLKGSSGAEATYMIQSGMEQAMTKAVDPKTLMGQAAGSVLDYDFQIENALLKIRDFEVLRNEHPEAYYRLVGDLVKAAATDYAGALIARAIELRGEA
jgi:hypothetical protein